METTSAPRWTLEAAARGDLQPEPQGWPRRLVRALDAIGLLAPLTLREPEEDVRRAEPRGSADELEAWFLARGARTSGVRSAEIASGETGRHHLIVSARPDWVRVLYHLHPSPSEAQASAATLETLALALPGVFAGAALGRHFGIAVSDLSWEPRGDWDRAWDPDMIVSCVSARFHREHRLGRPRQAQALREAELPAGASRRRAGDLTIVRWCEDVSDPDALRAGLEAKQAWLARHPRGSA